MSENKSLPEDKSTSRKIDRQRFKSSATEGMNGSIVLINKTRKQRFEDLSPIKQHKKQTSFIKMGSVVDLKASQTDANDT